MITQKDNVLQIKRLAQEKDYFDNVFKRIEKIVSVSFYILSQIQKKDEYDSILSLIKDTALRLHEQSLQTLRCDAYTAKSEIFDLQLGLVRFESILRVAAAADSIPRDIFELLIDQLDSVERYIQNHYLQDESNISTEYEPKARKQATSKSTSSPPTTYRRRVSIPSGDISSDAYMVHSHLTDRAERIKTVLEAKPQATIKDIAEIVTDVSEKTIQRELNSLIEKGQVIREGERRWSRYSVAK